MSVDITATCDDHQLAEFNTPRHATPRYMIRTPAVIGVDARRRCCCCCCCSAASTIELHAF